MIESRTTQRNFDGVRKSFVTLGSSLGAIVLALVICAVLLLLTGKDPLVAYRQILETGLSGDKLLEMLKRATPLMFSATAVAIGFKMNLFNIGVEGQYLFAALIAAEMGTHVSLPAPLHVLFILLVAMIAGAAWASIAALLKIGRGVNEVISTIMLNFIALSFIQWLFDNFFRDDSDGGLNVKTTKIAPSGRMPDLVHNRLSGMFIVALIVVALYWVVVFRSRFGFQLRASGLNPIAARTAGIPANRMVLLALMLSGAVAGLVAMPSVIGDVYGYGPSATPTQFGFAGIAVALLGRNHPVGIVSAALLFGFLDSTSAELQLSGVPSSIVKVIQAIIVLVVVIVNEASSRWLNRRTAERAAIALKGLASVA
ncbi:MAG: ABC transporter permease [Acidimicrobiaceae bacterium]|nr:ABC transporter permease [Acidimicrobiaceae bacterium]